MAELKWGAATHPGQIRPDNEDHLHASQGVYVVADGMGGHEAGEVASALAVERIRETLADEEAAPTAERVVEAIASANGDIFRAAIANPGQAGMGTTVTVIAVIKDPMAGRGEPNIDDNDPIEPKRITPIVPLEKPEALVLANVGDSRTYLLRHGRLRRVTIDHSYVQELVSTGHITDDEARTHPRRNIITRALGIEPEVKVDWWTLPLVRGDRFLLCSDGLVDEIDDAAIVETLLSHPDPQDAVDSLIEQANAAGGRDNVTVIVLDVLEGDDPPDPTQELDLSPTWADDPTLTPEDLARIEAGELTPAPSAADEVATTAGRRQRRRDRNSAKREGAAADAATAASPAAPIDGDAPVLRRPAARAEFSRVGIADGRYLLLTRRDNGSGTGTASLGVDLHDRQADTTTPFFERPATDTMLDAQWSPDGMHWILRSRTEEADATRNRLFVAAVGTPGIERVFYTGMSPDPTFHDHGPYQALPDGSGVLYSGGFFGSAPRQALRVGLWDALQNSTSTYGFPRAGSRVLDLALTPDAAHVVYLADETDGVVQLFRRTRHVDEAGVRLNAALPGGRHVLSMALSPDGTQLLYVTSSAADAVRDGELYRVALDAPEQAQRLGGPGTPALDVRQARVLPDGSGAVVLAEGGDAGVAALYHVAFDTPADMRQLSVGSLPGAAVRAFAVRRPAPTSR